MSDLTLKDGREITYDLDAITLDEYNSLFDVKSNNDKAVVAKAIGWTVEQVGGLGALQYKRVVRALVKKMGEPLSDPT
jgi:hypothetical protein